MIGKLLAMAVLALSLSGCALFMKKPRVTLNDISVVGLDTDGVNLELLLSVQNSNTFDVALRGYTYDLRLMALPMAKGGARETLEFRRDAVTDVRLPLRLNYKNLIELLKRRPDPDKVPYQLNAGFELETPFSTLTVPVDKSGTFAIPPQYRPAYFYRQLTDLLGAKQ